MNKKRPYKFSILSAEVLIACIDAKSITVASERLGMTQPNVSMHIKRLEESLGFDLFSRKRGAGVDPSKPTARAMTVYRAANAMLMIAKVVENIREEASEESAPIFGNAA